VPHKVKISKIEEELFFLRNKKRKLLDDIDNFDTQIIGLKLELENLKEKERRRIDSLPSYNDRLFDEDD
jgi:hypothetical protein